MEGSITPYGVQPTGILNEEEEEAEEEDDDNDENNNNTGWTHTWHPKEGQEKQILQISRCK